jgi:hypothetical protein
MPVPLDYTHGAWYIKGWCLSVTEAEKQPGNALAPVPVRVGGPSAHHEKAAAGLRPCNNL